MTTIRLTTENLELIACTIETVRAEISDKFNFSQLLNAFIPHTWPPEFNDDETMSFTLQRLQSAPEDLGWWCWYFVLKDEITDARTLIGNGGFKGKPTPDGTVEIGYSVLQEFQNRGYATEAIQALISWAFEYPEIRQVIAETLPELKASQRVLEKNQFTYVGKGSEEGTIRYELSRSHQMNPKAAN